MVEKKKEKDDKALLELVVREGLCCVRGLNRSK
jgi:hypothetical protein